MTLNREERVFCGKYKELCELSHPKSENDLLRISIILRLLLNEGLWHHANRRPQLDVKYKIKEIPQELQDEILSIIDSAKLLMNDASFLSPEIGFPENIKEIPTSEFLALVVHKARWRSGCELDIEEMDLTTITVREVISYGANILGGAHVGKPKKKIERSLFC